MSVHTLERSHLNANFVKKIASKGDLTRHMRTHTREKPFKYKFCEKGFSTKQNLTGHEYTHEKSHSNVMFVKKDFLKRET